MTAPHRRAPHVPPPVLLAAAGLAQRLLSPGAPPARPWRSAASATLAVACGALLTTAALTFASRRTTVSPLSPERVSALITTGPNAFTRNPMYLGMAGLLLAHALYRGSPSAVVPVALFILAIDRLQIPGEESALWEAFGADYEAYRARVPRWIGRSASTGRFAETAIMVALRSVTPHHASMTSTAHQHDGHASPSEEEAASYFEPPAWEERYAGDGAHWSGNPNTQLVAEASRLSPGTALDVGCGEGGDVIWLAQQGWQATGADFSANGLARAARHAEESGVAERVEFWQVDARAFQAEGRQYDLVTTHYLHPPDGGMLAVMARLADAVAPGGHLLIVGHAPSAGHPAPTKAHERAMFLAADLLSGVPEGFDVLVAEQRPRSVLRQGRTVAIDDSVLLARRSTS